MKRLARPAVAFQAALASLLQRFSAGDGSVGVLLIVKTLTPADQGQVVDMLAVENSKLDAKLRTICRGC